jgi:hypothetical protein
MFRFDPDFRGISSDICFWCYFGHQKDITVKEEHYYDYTFKYDYPVYCRGCSSKMSHPVSWSFKLLGM